MHVAILGPSHPWRGGIAHYTASLYRALERGGHRVTAFNFEELYPELLFPGKTQLDSSDAAFAVPAERMYAPLDPLSWLRVARRLVELRPDRLVLQWWHPFFAPGYAAVCAAARLAQIPTVFVCHNVSPHETTVVDRPLLRLAYALPSRFVVQSDTQAALLEELVGPGRDVGVAAHPPYEIFESSEATVTRRQGRRRWDVQAEHCLVFFGLVRPYKGLDTLLDAAARLPDTLDWELVVAGEFYEPLQDYAARVEELGLGDRVRLEDRYIANEEVPALFAAADLCVLPYRHATGSGVAGVATQFGTPLVMSDLANLRDAHGDDAVYWARPGDADDFATTIEAALADDRRSPTADGSPRSWQTVIDQITRPFE